METANIDNLLGPYAIGPLCPRLIDGLCLRIARAHEKAMMFVNMPATYLRLVPGHLPTVPVLLGQGLTHGSCAKLHEPV